MARTANRKRDVERAAAVVRDTGGRVVGRTRLQKIAYLLELAGVGDGFAFEYRHYGPYSEDLATATRDAGLLGLLKEDEHPTSWGGFYSVFTTKLSSDENVSKARKSLAQIAAQADSIELELAATAAFLSTEGEADPWLETARRKPEKAQDGRLENAKALYQKLCRVNTPVRLPEICGISSSLND